MMRTLKTLYGLGVILSILLGFFTAHEHAVFPWHGVPSVDAVLGVFGALLLLAGVKGVEIIVFRGESFYD